MTYSFNPKYSYLLFSMAIAAGTATAGTGPAFGHIISQDQIRSEMIAEVERDGQQFSNLGEETQLRHRVHEQDKENARKERAQKQYKTMNKHQYQGETGNYSQPMRGSGSMNRGGGGGGGRR